MGKLVGGLCGWGMGIGIGLKRMSQKCVLSTWRFEEGKLQRESDSRDTPGGSG